MYFSAISLSADQKFLITTVENPFCSQCNQQKIIIFSISEWLKIKEFSEVIMRKFRIYTLAFF